jgi:hypothetical protein
MRCFASSPQDQGSTQRDKRKRYNLRFAHPPSHNGIHSKTFNAQSLEGDEDQVQPEALEPPRQSRRTDLNF